MAELLASGRLVDLILALVVLEAIVLVLWHRRTGRGLVPRDLLPNLAAGACLLLALRAVLAEAPWYCASAALAGAGLAHLLDLGLRWRGKYARP